MVLTPEVLSVVNMHGIMIISHLSQWLISVTMVIYLNILVLKGKLITGGGGRGTNMN